MPKLHTGELKSAILEGHYAKKQIMCDARLISWSHRMRMQIGLELAKQFAGQRVLDYGCGDGTFLALLMSAPHAPCEAIGSELYPSTVQECETRLADAKLHFVTVDDLDSTGPFDGMFCMEVLEHVVDVSFVLDRLEHLLAPKGKLLISVPVETGLPLIFKQIARRIAGWRGLGDYPGTGPYTFGEYITSLFAGARQHIVRPVDGVARAAMFPDHKGFNWMAFQVLLTQRFEIEKILSSPIPWLPPHLASQVWFVLRKKARA